MARTRATWCNVSRHVLPDEFLWFPPGFVFFWGSEARCLLHLVDPSSCSAGWITGGQPPQRHLRPERPAEIRPPLHGWPRPRAEADTMGTRCVRFCQMFTGDFWVPQWLVLAGVAWGEGPGVRWHRATSWRWSGHFADGCRKGLDWHGWNFGWGHDEV